MFDWLTYLAKEWAVIRQAPFAALVCGLIGAFIAYWFVKAMYRERIQRLEVIIADYKERLGLVPPTRTAYSKLTNRELQREVSDFTPKLREFSAKVEDESTRQLNLISEYTIKAKTEEERQQVWSRQTNDLSAMSNRHRRGYNEGFRSEAILLRDEMLRRLPKQEKRRNIDVTYEFLSGPRPLDEIASDLEQLSKLLPRGK